MPRVSGWTPVTVTASRQPATQAARFAYQGAIKTGVPEASDVTALPGGRFLVVSDTKDTATVVDGAGKAVKLELPGLKKDNSQLEGAAYDPVKKRLFVAREESNELLRYDWDATKKGAEPELNERITLQGFKGPRNKGIEGLSYIPGEFSPTGTPQLLLAKEGTPRELLLARDSGKGELLPIKLDKQALAVCRDFSGAAVDPKTGHLFVSSDESATVVQLKLARDGDKVVAKLVQAFPIVDERGKPIPRIEGISFNERGDLYVLAENTGKLHRFSRQ
jgi:uncharacterized protein YjiK